MSWLDGAILGIVQGLTEFLPISSSGHLVLAKAFLGLKTPGVVMEAVLHLGTLLAVLLFYRADLSLAIFGFLGAHRRWLSGRGSWSQVWNDEGARLGYLIIVGTVPAVIIGLTFKDLIESLFESVLQTGVELIFNSFILFWAASLKSGDKGISRTGIADALAIGAGQALAILPAISRSGSTVAAALWRGLDRVAAVRFSFLLSIPAIAGSMILQLDEIIGADGGQLGAPLLVGALTSAVSGYLAIAIFIRMVATGKLSPFAWYSLIVGSAVVAQQLLPGR